MWCAFFPSPLGSGMRPDGPLMDMNFNPFVPGGRDGNWRPRGDMASPPSHCPAPTHRQTTHPAPTLRPHPLPPTHTHTHLDHTPCPGPPSDHTPCPAHTLTTPPAPLPSPRDYTPWPHTKTTPSALPPPSNHTLSPLSSYTTLKSSLARHQNGA